MRNKIDWLKKNWVLAIAVTWSIIGLALLIIYWASTWQGWNGQTLDWQALTGFATWVLAGGAAIAVEQIRQARRSTSAQIIIDSFWRFKDDKAMQEALKKIGKLDAEQSDNQGNSIGQDIERVVGWFDVVGALANKNAIDCELAIELFGDRAVWCWDKLAKYIRGKQTGRGYYAENYEVFARRCVDYFTENKIPVKFEKDEKQKGKDLVGKLKELVESQKNEAAEKRLYHRSISEIKRARNRKNK